MRTAESRRVPRCRARRESSITRSRLVPRNTGSSCSLAGQMPVRMTNRRAGGIVGDRSTREERTANTPRTPRHASTRPGAAGSRISPVPLCTRLRAPQSPDARRDDPARDTHLTAATPLNRRLNRQDGGQNRRRGRSHRRQEASQRPRDHAEDRT